MIELLELKFSRRWQTNKIESDWSNSPRHSSSRQFRSPRNEEVPESLSAPQKVLTDYVASICSKLAFDCPRLLSNSSEDPLRQNIKRPVTYEGVGENFDTTKLVEKKRLKKDHESKHANVSMPTLHDNDPSDGSQSSDSLNRVNESFDDSNDFHDGFVDGNTSDHSDEGFKNSMDKNFQSRDPDRKIVSITSDTEKDNIFDSNSKGDLENNSNMSQPVELNQRKVA